MQGAPVRAGELDQAAQVTLTGRAGRVVYRSPDEGFRVMMLDTDQGPIRVTGALPEFPRGQTITVTGAWRTHATHGRQLVAEAAQETDPVTEKGIIGYLVRIPGIGPGRARALYQAHGQGVFDALDRDPGVSFPRCRGCPPGTGRKRRSRGVGPGRTGTCMSFWQGTALPATPPRSTRCWVRRPSR